MTGHRKAFAILLALAAAALVPAGAAQDLLGKLGAPQDFAARRVSSFDRSGGNRDSLPIQPGETAVLADLKGPGAVHHIWVTIAAEAFYGRKIVLRMYWDGEENPSVEAPIGDFFGVGHGLNRNFASLPITCSSEGRARNCYWYMPFRKSARITVTNEGSRAVSAFYYYLDYRELPALDASTPLFHAQYRQDMPCRPGENFTILEAAGRGHYVGCSLSVLQKALGWWGEGDDMIFIDGERTPSLHGTGSEDYFSDAWGMRESQSLFYGCPLQEEDFQAGSKATVYRFHIPDPIPFRKSIKVTIEHGHANDRSDDYSSTAYWYQVEPHAPFAALPPVGARLPFALEPPSGFVLPRWEKSAADGTAYEDAARGVKFKAAALVSSLTSYYGPSGARFPVLTTDRLPAGSSAELVFPVEVPDIYDLDLYLLKGPAMGNFEIAGCLTGSRQVRVAAETFAGYAPERAFSILPVRGLRLEPGTSRLILHLTGRDPRAAGGEIGLIGYRLAPAARKFLSEWNILGPFEAPDMDSLTMVYPPEDSLDLELTAAGKGGRRIGWRKVQALPDGYVPLGDLIEPNENVIVYAAGWVRAPEDMTAHLLLGSDDGVRVWINGALVHHNPAYRASVPDLDRVRVRLRKGWNAVLLKILQGSGAFGFHVRFADPDGRLSWSTDAPAR